MILSYLSQSSARAATGAHDPRDIDGLTRAQTSVMLRRGRPFSCSRASTRAGGNVVGDIELTVHVGSERVQSFYEWFGRWLSNDETGVTVPFGRVIPSNDEPWNVASDLARAKAMVRALSAPAREVLGLVSDQAGSAVSTDYIASRIGGVAAAVTQIVADIALAADAQDRRCPIRGLDAGGTPAFWMRADEATRLFGPAVMAPDPEPPAGTDPGGADAEAS